MNTVNFDIYKKVLPESVFQWFVEAMTKFNIINHLRCSHFISQAAHESGDFKLVSENLNYSAERLIKVFPRYFNNEQAILYQRQPEKIASRIYAGRMGNGTELTKDGYKFRGRGYFQLTGTNNYKEFGNYICEDLLFKPDLVATPKYAALSAAWFFFKNNLNQLADKGSADVVVTEMTKKINGGLNGYNDRLKRFKIINDFVI